MSPYKPCTSLRRVGVVNKAFSIFEGDEGLAARLESELLSALSLNQTQALNTGFTLSANAAEGELIGGLVASTSYSWLLVKILWVEESQRHLGVGRSLMEAAETKAIALGCHSVWLDTSNANAKKFYDALGYQVFGALENSEGQVPPDHCRWFMKKTL